MVERAGRLGIGIVGAGKVGAVLGTALGGAGHAVIAVSAVSEQSRDRADALLPGVPVLEVSEVVRRSELVILAVPTDQLAELVAGLAALGAWQPGQLVMHTAARFGVGVLDPARAAGVIPLAIHPVLRFTGTSLDVARLAGAWFAVTAPAPVLPIAQALVVEMGGEPFVVAEGDRAAFADAVDAAGGFADALVEQATSTLDALGVARSGAILGPLVRSAVDAALARHDVGPE